MTMGQFKNTETAFYDTFFLSLFVVAVLAKLFLYWALRHLFAGTLSYRFFPLIKDKSIDEIGKLIESRSLEESKPSGTREEESEAGHNA